MSKKRWLLGYKRKGTLNDICVIPQCHKTKDSLLAFINCSSDESKDNYNLYTIYGDINASREKPFYAVSTRDFSIYEVFEKVRFIEEVKFCSCCHKQIMHDEEYETVNGYYFHKKDC